MTLPIETERLILRKYREADIPDIVEYSADPEISRVVSWARGKRATPDSVGAFIKSQRNVLLGAPEWLDLAIELKQKNKVAGTIGMICRPHHQGQIGFALGTGYQMQGLATEAAQAILELGFTAVGLHRIYAETTTWNRRSWKLMERIHMRREAHFRESEYNDGEWRDGLIYAVLRTEWESRQPASR